MNVLTWLALAGALLLLPLGDRVTERVQLLGSRGRLQLPRSHAARWRPPRVSMSMPFVGAIVFVVVTVRAGPVLAVAAGAAVAAIGSLVRSAVRNRTAERSAARLLAAVRAMVAEVAAGAGPAAALQAAADVDPERAAAYVRAAEAARDGTDPGQVLVGDPALAPVGHALSVAAVTGAPIGAVLERVVADLVARREQSRAVATALAGPRSSAVVLASLPVVGVLLGVAMDADPIDFLVGSSTGQLVCLIGVLLDLAGLFWTRRLAAGAAGSSGPAPAASAAGETDGSRLTKTEAYAKTADAAGAFQAERRAPAGRRDGSRTARGPGSALIAATDVTGVREPAGIPRAGGDRPP